MVSRPAGTLLRRACDALALLLLALGLLCSNSAKSTDKPPELLIAIGDVHGDFDDFCLLLKKVG